VVALVSGVDYFHRFWRESNARAGKPLNAA
jgi:hypothetical protein